MRVPLADVGCRGRMDLTFALQNGQTVLRHAYCETPFKITRLLNSRGRVLIRQQSATKIHPSQGRPAIQRNHVLVDTGAELQLFLEPIIPFAGSCLRQMTQINVQPGARLVFWEGFMAGRVGRGERWQFREITLETRLLWNQQPVYLDRFRLPNGLERSPCAMGESGYLGTGFYVGEHARSFATTLHQILPEAGIDTPVAEVAITRVVSTTGPDFHRSREIFSLQAERMV